MLGYLVNLSMARKLAIIALVFTLPIAFLLYYTYTILSRSIQQTRIERIGVEFTAPLVDLIERIPEFQLMSRRAAEGDRNVAGALGAERTNIDVAVTQLQDLGTRYGAELRFTDAELARLGRPGATPEAIQRAWAELREAKPGQTSEETEAGLRRLRALVRDVLLHAIDTSRLAIDPDLDTFYLGFATLLHNPRISDRLGNLMLIADEGLARKEGPTIADRLALATEAALLESELSVLNDRVRTAIEEDANYSTASVTLKTTVAPALKAVDSEIRPFLATTRRLAEADAVGVTRADYLAAAGRVREAIQTLGSALESELALLLTARGEAERWTRLSTLLLNLGALAVAMILMVLVARTITGPVGQCARSLTALADRDLTPRTRSGRRDEIGTMATALADAVDGMRSAVVKIGQSAGVVRKASDDLSTASQEMSASAEETSAQANVVSAAAEQVSKSVQTVATSAQEMGASIREVAQQTQEASRVAVAGVKVASATNAKVSKLGESSREIGQVIKVITSIAEQTNLLALNATIEAARVGEAGKGFAVVANEVKELARETARATEEIGRKIEAIQADSRGAVEAITEIGSIINQFHEIQSTIASAMEEQTVTTREIGRNVAEAAGGTAEIARNIVGVAEAARQTSQGAQQTRKSADQLTRLAGELAGVVGQFRVEADAPAVQAPLTTARRGAL